MKNKNKFIGKLQNYMDNYKPPKFIFSRLFYFLLFILIEIALVILIMLALGRYSIWFYLSFELVGLVVAFIIVNDKGDPAFKISWLVFDFALPFIGSIFYLIFARNRTGKKFKKRIQHAFDEMAYGISCNDQHQPIEFLKNQNLVDAYNIASFLESQAKITPFQNTNVTYYQLGDLALNPIVEALKNAKHFIFLEYFIIKPGRFWNSILEVLTEKAKEGLDVRVLYDDFGCSSTLTHKYYRLLRENGIKAYKVNRVKPFIDARMNNRDHRKIIVIDGYIGFTGGINLADEYINEDLRFGKWKDNCIRLVGEGVYGLTVLFLQMWQYVTKTYKTPINYYDYLPSKYMSIELIRDPESVVQPYGLIPLTHTSIGASLYEMILSKAKRFVYISTPYLILNSQLEHAIIQCAQRGVKVKIITPGIPDKKIVFQLTRANYKNLVNAGVEIYEYTPGFIHAKMIVADGEMASVGTVNFDYRSLFLHYENGVYLYHNNAVKDVVNDFENTFLLCSQYTKEMVQKTKWYKRLIRSFLKVFAPMM